MSQNHAWNCPPSYAFWLYRLRNGATTLTVGLLGLVIGMIFAGPIYACVFAVFGLIAGRLLLHLCAYEMDSVYFRKECDRLNELRARDAISYRLQYDGRRRLEKENVELKKQLDANPFLLPQDLDLEDVSEQPFILLTPADELAMATVSSKELGKRQKGTDLMGEEFTLPAWMAPTQPRLLLTEQGPHGALFSGDDDSQPRG